MFNECPIDAWVEHATRVGFNLVMLADSNASHADLARRVADLAPVAHSRGVAVEAELGVLPCSATEHSERGSLTDPDQVEAFVRETGVDMLAVSVGNVHVRLDDQCDLNLGRLSAIRRRVDTPLVLHGGSGIADGSLAEAIAIGVAKVNYGTYLKQRCLAAIRRALSDSDVVNPHYFLGYGGDADLMVASVGRCATQCWNGSACWVVAEGLELSRGNLPALSPPLPCSGRFFTACRGFCNGYDFQAADIDRPARRQAGSASGNHALPDAAVLERLHGGDLGRRVLRRLRLGSDCLYRRPIAPTQARASIMTRTKESRAFWRVGESLRTTGAYGAKRSLGVNIRPPAIASPRPRASSAWFWSPIRLPPGWSSL